MPYGAKFPGILAGIFLKTYSRNSRIGGLEGTAIMLHVFILVSV